LTYNTLLVPVEAQPDPDHRLAFAVDLANQFGAKLIGVGAEAWRSIAVGGLENGYAAATFIEAEMAMVKADLKRAEAKFGAAARAVRRGSDWRSAIQFPTAEIAAQARAADLIVTSRSPRHASEYNAAAPGTLALEAGRPVLVAPTDTDRLELNSVVVAWKDTRESRRAVSDALPLLKRAPAVVVAEICDHAETKAAKMRLEDVAASLLRHGVHASTEVCVEAKRVDLGHQFLEFADHHKADLIVAGAYGHSRMQQWAFGGFTRTLLAQTSRALLFSH
jgi:nucleotide-binding universal stress UspA family protein